MKAIEKVHAGEVWLDRSAIARVSARIVERERRLIGRHQMTPE